MTEGYCPDSKDDQLDELMCEYVDGTMDAAVRAAFEELLDANPELADQAHCLCRTRELLSAYGCRHSPHDIEAEIRCRVAMELSREQQLQTALTDRLSGVAVVTSVACVLMLIGVMAGMSVFMEPSVDGEQLALEEPVLPGGELASPVDAHGAIASGSLPLDRISASTVPPLVAPVNALPVISTSSSITPRRDGSPGFGMARSPSRSGLLQVAARD
ncbi:MAG: hypothetical protein COV99_05525 [Bacteroidetes bacterium CG12_big_fil_rev_8_21_14_0_65_60_17]|nr:MAG: hypothetical protein COV99_05525 [Bacteroidetes bacterium CG12_big_fil_rev_8_21_14_0_65_60_17]